ncbi:hypothetical protein [Cupriavidus basilensis]|uniref:hypothetical protein n=1 Tax=Cupriavidus basilensis TaxID=68895 RepID=UPI001184F635|nr:hypothetical protein [Cupriavidus basilensis]
MKGHRAGKGGSPGSGATRCKMQEREASGSANLVVPTRRRINRPVPRLGKQGVVAALRSACRALPTQFDYAASDDNESAIIPNYSDLVIITPSPRFRATFRPYSGRIYQASPGIPAPLALFQN